MSERNLNFDEVVNRRGTHCLKYDYAVASGHSEDELPLWIADMDFRTSSYVEDALVDVARHGIFGYTEGGEEYYNAVAGWYERRFGWRPTQESLVKTCGVVPALGIAISAFTERGDGVLIQQPVYYCFSLIIKNANRRVVNSELYIGNDGKFHIDFDDFERKIVEEKIKMFILCNPHNPGGRSWNREELECIAEICLRHNVIVASDEIHSDFILTGHKHTVFETLSEKVRNITITLTSPGKTFNLSGLQIANVFIANRELRHRFVRELKGIGGYSQANAMGTAAVIAANSYGEEWFEKVWEYIQDNLQFVRDYIAREIPQISLMVPEATYLLLLDFRKLGLPENQLDDLIRNKAKLWLNSGAMFGKIGEGFERVNLACQRSVIEEALKRIKNAVNDLLDG